MPAVGWQANQTRTAVRSHRTAVLALGLAALTLISGCAGKPQAAHGSNLDSIGATVYPVGHRGTLPEITGTTLAGQKLTLPASTRRTIVVINVWASWCTQCRTESPEIAELAKSLNGHGVRFVGIDEQDAPGAARNFSAKAGMAYPQLIDRNGEMLAKLTLLPSFGIPSTLVVDRNGQMAARIIGPTSRAQLNRVIEQVQRH